MAERFDQLAERVHANAKAKGFWDHRERVVRDPVLGDVEGRVTNPSIIPEKLALVHSEVSEALEALRDDDMVHFEEELADVLIRVLDIAAFCGLSMDAAVEAKVELNSARPRLHGRSW